MARTKILIVEDEPVLLKILAETIAELGFPVLTAPNGKVAFELLHQDRYIVAVLSDINMPVMSGLELLAKMRSDDYETPFIFLTGYGDKETALKAMQLGALGLIDKPYDTQKLLDIVKKSAELGVALQELDAEVEESIKNARISPGKLNEFRKNSRKILKIKKINSIMQKKSA